MQKLPSRLPFGSLAAEDEDGSLESVYVSDVLDQRHQAALSPHHRVMLGLRGSGKTALARFLKFQKLQPFEVYVSIHQRTAFGRILADVEECLSRSRVPFSEDIVRLWILAFWTALMSELQATGQLRSPAVRKYLSAAQPKGPLGREQILLDGLAASLRSEQSTLLDWDRLRALLDISDYSVAQEETRQYLDRHPRTTIVIDSLEDAPIESAAMINVTTALLTAVNRRAELHEHVHVKCLVPTELWRFVSTKMAGMGKIAPFEMRWSPDDLLRLVCLRYTNYVVEQLGADAPVLPSTVTWTSAQDTRSKVWGRYFPSRAPGSSGLYEDVETLLMRHTQLRPRQLIYLCNDIAARSATTRFNPNHIRDAIREKSDDLVTAVFAAHLHTHPDAEATLRRHLHNSPAVFDAKAFRAEDDLWRVGYELGVLGPLMTKSARPFDGAEFQSYRRAGFNFCGTAATNWRPEAEMVAVHPMFHRRFGIVETADTMVGLDGWWM